VEKDGIEKRKIYREVSGNSVILHMRIKENWVTWTEGRDQVRRMRRGKN
jgi:hypothetical protein